MSGAPGQPTVRLCGAEAGVGYLLAFERKTGKLVWHRATPALSFHQENYFQIVNGRLYTGDYGTMRIYEEVNATDPRPASPALSRARKVPTRVVRAKARKPNA